MTDAQGGNLINSLSPLESNNNKIDLYVDSTFLTKPPSLPTLAVH